MRNDLPKQTFDKIMSKSVHLKVCKYCKQTIGEIKVLIPQYGRVGALVVCPTCGAETKLHGISQCFFSGKSMGTPILNGSIISGINKAVKDWNGGLYGYRTKGSKTLRDLDGKEIDNIGNGVIVLPCKVGDTVYELKANGRIVKGIVQSIHQNLVGNEQGRWIVTSWFDNYYADSKKAGFECGSHLYSPFEDFGKTVFLTKEEAEKALKESENGECYGKVG